MEVIRREAKIFSRVLSCEKTLRQHSGRVVTEANNEFLADSDEHLPGNVHAMRDCQGFSIAV